MLLILFLLFLLTSPVSADDFNIHGDSRYSDYKHTTAIAQSYIPESIEGAQSLIYDYSLTEGEETQEVLDNESVHTLTDTFYKRRIPGKVDRVSGPPGTRVDFIYKYCNYAGHSVDVSKVVAPFSKEDPGLGNWLNVATMEGNLPIQRSISIYFDFRWILKTALFKEYIGPGVLEDGQEGFLLLDTLTISNPIKIQSIEVEELVEENKGVKVLVVIKNRSEETLENMFFEHHTYHLEFTMPPLEEITIEYLLEDFDELGYFKIHNPNAREECAIQGNPQYQWFWGGGVTVIGYREDGGWIHGSTVQPEGDNFCISRIPYTMTSPILEYEKSPDSDNIKEDEIVNPLDEQESLEEEGKIEDEEKIVLGIVDTGERNEIGIEEYEGINEDNFVLPKTGVVR